jgi:hypothetical protein
MMFSLGYGEGRNERKWPTQRKPALKDDLFKKVCRPQAQRLPLTCRASARPAGSSINMLYGFAAPTQQTRGRIGPFRIANLTQAGQSGASFVFCCSA